MLNKIFKISQEKEHTIFKFLFFKLKFKNKKICTVIYEPGGIGDYMISKRYFEYFRKSKKFKNKYLIYITKSQFVNITNEFNNNIFDEIWGFNLNDTKSFKQKIQPYTVETLVFLPPLAEYNNYSIKNNRKNIIKLIKPKKTIVDVLIGKNIDTKKIEKQYHPIYSKEHLFETDRKKIFFENLLDLKIPNKQTKNKQLLNLKKKYICISLRTNDSRRNYNKKNWIDVINHINDTTTEEYQILFIGSNTDYDYTEKIIKSLTNNEKCINLCGRIDLSLIPSFLSNAEFLLTPETGTVHIAHSVGCQVICLSTGSCYGRYLPYKENVEYIFPEEFQNLIKQNQKEILSNFYKINFKYSMDSIRPKDVIKIINKYIQ